VVYSKASRRGLSDPYAGTTTKVSSTELPQIFMYPLSINLSQINKTSLKASSFYLISSTTRQPKTPIVDLQRLHSKCFSERRHYYL